MEEEQTKKPMDKKLETSTKTKVNPKIAAGVVILVGLVGLSFFGASLLSTGVSLINSAQCGDNAKPTSCCPHRVATGDLLAYYSFDGNTQDSSGNNYLGIAYGNPTVIQEGVAGQAYEFDGVDDYIALPIKYCSNHQIKEITICAWFRTNETSGGTSDNWALVDFDRSEYFNLFVTPDGKIVFATHSKENGDINELESSEQGLNDNDWHFVCAVYDANANPDYDQGVKTIYIDGRKDAEETGVHNGKPLGSDETRFGIIGDGSEAVSMNGDRNDFYYKGAIDEVRIYEKALTLSKTRNLYNRSLRTYTNENTLKYCSDFFEPWGIEKCVYYIALSIDKNSNYDTLYPQRVAEICNLVGNCDTPIADASLKADFKIATVGKSDTPRERLLNSSSMSGYCIEEYFFFSPEAGTCATTVALGRPTLKPSDELPDRCLVFCGDNSETCTSGLVYSEDIPYISATVQNLISTLEECNSDNPSSSLTAEQCQNIELCLCQICNATCLEAKTDEKTDKECTCSCNDIHDIRKYCEEKIANENWFWCPPGKKEGCCPPELSQCCTGWFERTNSTVCCKPEPIETCESFPVVGHYCNPQICEDDEWYCRAKLSDCCCKKINGYEKEDICGSASGVAYCKEPDECEEGDPGYCDGMCCNVGPDGQAGTDDDIERCESSGGVSACQPIDENSCDPDEEFCQGWGDWKERKKCCPIGTSCEHHPNDYPYCYKPSE